MKNFLMVATLVAATAGTTKTQAADANVRIYNRSSYDVVTIHVSPPKRNRYGDQDLLGRRVLQSGYNVQIDFNVDDAENFCVLDVLAKGTRDSRWTKRINVCEETEWNLTDRNKD